MLPAPKPAAALTSGLLARKGEARPAMRPQTALSHSADDCGWNDTGADSPPASAEAREIHRGGARAAFTLRLDTDRHLRLRLASAVCNRSAQQLVTEALDALLESLPEVDALARQLDGAAADK